MFINKYNINQVVVSESIPQIKKYFSEYKYVSDIEPTLFFGLYNQKDLNFLKNHKGKIYIFWFDNECNPKYNFRKKNVYFILRNYKIEKHFVNSCNTAKYLSYFNIDYEMIYEYFTSENIKFKILTNKKLESVSFYLKSNLNHFGYDSDVIYNLSDDIECKSYIYILIYIKYFTELNYLPPRNYIFYQMEQNGSNMINDKYISLMQNAIKIFDFSSANKFYNKYIDLNKYCLNLFQLPLQIKPNENNSEFDILFYGEYNDRRLKILKYLSNLFNVKYSNNLFRTNKIDLIKKCKLVLNIHYYENACLETCRINEILEYSKIILSENINKDDDNKIIYENSVIFFDKISNDLSNIDMLVYKIQDILSNYNEYIKKMNIKKIQDHCQNNLIVNLENLFNEKIHIYDKFQDISSLKNTCKGQDIYVIGSGTTCNYIKKSFLSNKITIGINQVYVKYDCDYIILKDNQSFEYLFSKNLKSKIIISEYSSGVYDFGFNLFKINRNINFDNIFYFKHNNNVGKKDVNFMNINNDKYLLVSWSTVVSAVNLAIHLGAKNIILVGIDEKILDGKYNFDQYSEIKNEISNKYKIENSKSNEYKNYIDSDILSNINFTCFKKLENMFDVNIYSINPFYSLKILANKLK